jgi:hypothetical protein
MQLDALIVTPTDLDAIEVVNEVQTTKKMVPVLAADGRTVLPADLLTDCHVGQTWADYREILLRLTRETVEMPEPSPE